MSTTGSSPGASLRAVIDASRRLDELSTARVIEQAAEATHKQQKSGQSLGILSPDAIFVGAEGIEIKPGHGTASAYAAPEAADGKTGDRRSDVYALGAILWEALVHEKRTAGTFVPPSELNANVPSELDAICKKALSHDPAERFASTKVMAAEIASVLDDAGYPDDVSQIAEYLQVAFPPKSAGQSLAEKLAAATPTAPASSPKIALNQTMMGVGSAAAEVAAAVRQADAKMAEAAARAEEAKARIGTLPPPNATVTPAAHPSASISGMTVSSTTAPVVAAPTMLGDTLKPAAMPKDDGPLAAPPGPPGQTAPGGWEDGKGPAATLAAKSAAAEPAPASASVAGLTVSSLLNAPPTTTLPLGSTAITAADLEAHNRAVEAADSDTRTTPFVRAEAEEPAPVEPPTTKIPASIASAETLATPALVPDGPAPAAQVAGLPSLPPGADAVAKPKAVLVDSGPVAAVPVPASSSSTSSSSTSSSSGGSKKKKKKGGKTGPHNRSSSERISAEKITVERPAEKAPSSSVEVAPEATLPDMPAVDPVAAVSLPFRSRRDSQADMLEKWASTGESLEIDDEGHEGDILEEQRKQRKRLLVGTGGALAAILLVVVIAFAMGGSKKPKAKDEAPLASPTAHEVVSEDPPMAVPTEDIGATAGSGSADIAAQGSGSADIAAAGSADQGSADQGSGSADEAARLAAATAATADAERLAKEQEATRLAEEKRAKEEAERLAKEESARKLADEKTAKEEAKRLAKEEADRKAAADAEAKRLAKEEAAAKAAKVAEDKAAKAAEDKAARAEATRIARDEAAAKKKAADEKAAADRAARTAAAAKAPPVEPRPKVEPKPKAVTSAPVDPYSEPKRPTGGDPAALYKTGFQQYVRGDNTAALAAFKDAQAANPGYAPAYRGLGLVYEKMGQKDRAKVAFKKYLQLSPDAGDADQIRERMARL